MTPKVFLFVLLGATVALADLQSDYESITTQLENQSIIDYFQETDPLQQLIKWDQFLGHALLIIEKGRLAAVQSAGNNKQLAQAVKNAWRDVVEAGINGQYEVKSIIDGLRSEALRLAPKEWLETAQMSQRLIAIFKSAVRTGNPYEVRKSLTLCTNSFRQAKIRMESILASRRSSGYNF